MSEDLSCLIETFEGVGMSRGLMNGTPLGVVADPSAGYRVAVGQEQMLRDLRAYEKRKGCARSFRESMRMHIRADIVQARARKRDLKS
jgi:hypothetical protein